LVFQKLMKAPTEQVMKQFVLGVCVFVRNCRNCTVEINDSYVQVNLFKFKGFKGLYYKLMKKNKLTEFQTDAISKLMKFWFSFIDTPILNIVWKD
jgi:hypothetical protein